MINLLQGDSSQYKDPEVSPDGPTTTAPLDEATAARNAELELLGGGARPPVGTRGVPALANLRRPARREP